MDVWIIKIYMDVYRYNMGYNGIYLLWDILVSESSLTEGKEGKRGRVEREKKNR